MGPRRLVIVGAGGFGRETVELVRALNSATPVWDLLGILDDGPGRIGTTVAGLPVLGGSEVVHDLSDAAVVVAIGNPGNFVSRAQVVERLALAPERYTTLVHPTAVVPTTASIGAGSVVHAHTVMTTDVQLGSHVAVMPSVVFTHDDVVADFTTFGAGVRVAGGVTIGQGAYVGAAAVLREDIVVGRWALVGAGSVVTRSIPPGEVWAGVPARRLRDVERVGDLAVRLDGN